ncbi:MAG: glucosamine-6-phosphate deaminase [Victivallaceae bacterium]|nr:glucosamine-6-phosphate deaminase [Victivallaceae bacterium]
MEIKIYRNKTEMSAAAAEFGAELLRKALHSRGEAVMIAATAPSQFEMMEHLTAAPGIDWSKVTIFHLDEYIGLPAGHRAGFRLNLRKNLIDRLPAAPKKVWYVDGDHPEEFCSSIRRVMAEIPVDVAFVGVGENGHIAFNDPPADFETGEAFKIVTLDHVCRNQQFTEGWFPSLDAVPTTALSMTIPQIMKSAAIVNVVPDSRKAAAVRGMVEGAVSNLCPASILRTHGNCTTFLDDASASLLAERP